MKIGILTFHYGNNYGGLLQTFALCEILKEIGHQPIIINRLPNKKKKSLLKHLKNLNHALFKNYIYKAFQNFRDEQLQPQTQIIYDDDKINAISMQFDAVIVGSDQVWRMNYTNVGFNYFLDFVPKEIKKIAYAASFGKENFDGDNATKLKIEKLLKRFTAISVREDSGLSICKTQFNIDAVHLIDPTLLLSADDYQTLIEEKVNYKESKFLAYYFLDSNDTKLKLIARASEYMELNMKNISYSSIYPYSIKQLLIQYKRLKYTSFSDWLNNIKNSKFVITDSFHGVAFSIIFGKQFICIANQQRGLARMNSLLRLLGLMDRLIYDDDQLNYNFKSLLPIDYNRINSIIFNEKVKAIDFLKNALKL